MPPGPPCLKTLGAFNVLDYLEGGRPERVAEDTISYVYPELGKEIHEEPEPGWLGVPMLGQFPLSNWLTDKLNALNGGVEPIPQPERPVEPQIAHFDHCRLNPDRNVDLDPELSSSSSKFIDPRVGLLSLSPKERAQLVDTHIDNISPEQQVQADFLCGMCNMTFSSQGKLK
ncbi:hypothetical protein F5Y13DRAFT_193878 [Hypoxylon sp. FL1857]|nr:hypothetical protein F5Y13DRAFT_193878 [Hypoxylon sp. FL1857]